MPNNLRHEQNNVNHLMIETIQFDGLTSQITSCYPILLFFGFVIIISILEKVVSTKYHPSKNETQRYHKISVIIPVYAEKHERFDACLKSSFNQLNLSHSPEQDSDELIVVHDGEDKKVKEISQRYGARFLDLGKRAGKRNALIHGVMAAKNDLVLFVDSDTVLDRNFIEEIVKPLDDPKVGIVSCTKKADGTGKSFGGYLAWKISILVEGVRRINDSGLDGHLMVADGRCSLYRKKLIIPLIEKFTSEYYLGSKCEIGDDRFLTREIRKRGYKIAMQSTAIVTTASQPTFIKFLLQQIRWNRSDYKFFIQDLREKIYKLNGAFYLVQLLNYHICPFFFIGLLSYNTVVIYVMELDAVYGIEMLVLFVVLGTAIITVIRQIIFFGLQLDIDALLYGPCIYLVLFPLSIYAAITIKKQHIWGTRTRKEEEGQKKAQKIVRLKLRKEL